MTEAYDIRTGDAFESITDSGDRITLKVALELPFAKSFLVVKRVRCADQQRQSEHPDLWLALTAEQLQSDNLDFITVLRGRP
jgi:hypothetical protein